MHAGHVQVLDVHARHDAFSPTPAAMTANDAIHVGQPNTSAFKFFSGMKPLKNAKQFIGMFHVETGSVVANKDHVFIRTCVLATDFNFRRTPVPCVFDSIGQKIDEDLAEHGPIAPHDWQFSNVPTNIPTARVGFQRADCLFAQMLQINPRGFQWGASDPRKLQQVVDKLTHVPRRIDDRLQKAPIVFSERWPCLVREDLRVTSDMAQGSA